MRQLWPKNRVNTRSHSAVKTMLASDTADSPHIKCRQRAPPSLWCATDPPRPGGGGKMCNMEHESVVLKVPLWTPSNCCQFSYWNHSLSFSKHNNFAASAFWNSTCDTKIAPAKWRSQMRFEITDAFWNRSCVLKTHLRPELRRCDFRIAGAKLTSQLRSAAMTLTSAASGWSPLCRARTCFRSTPSTHYRLTNINGNKILDFPFELRLTKLTDYEEKWFQNTNRWASARKT